MARRKPSTVQIETPVFHKVEGPKKVGQMQRGWAIVFGRAAMTLDREAEAFAQRIADIDAEWRAKDKVGKELVRYQSA